MMEHELARLAPDTDEAQQASTGKTHGFWGAGVAGPVRLLEVTIDQVLSPFMAQEPNVERKGAGV